MAGAAVESPGYEAKIQPSHKFLLTARAILPILELSNLHPVGSASRPPAGLFFCVRKPVFAEPDPKRTIVFFDGQNLFHSAREAFGYTYPNFDPKLLAKRVCDRQSWSLIQTRFYTGIPNDQVAPTWHYFWMKKLAYMGTRGVICFSRALRYRNQSFVDSRGVSVTALVGQEKGIDVRIALDIVRLARRSEFDVALV